ncbi:MAG: hypothetical protein JWP12_1208 [Bacteroidetes bacterium]|nr:hypothetical protein [Bacteroidota bacterium]
MKQHLHFLKVIYFVTMMSPLLLILVFKTTLPKGTPITNHNLDDVLKYIVPALGIVWIAAGFLIYNAQLKKIVMLDETGKLLKHRSVFVLRAALIEATGMFAAIAFMLTTNNQYIAYVFLALLAYLPIYPTEERVKRELDL